jgi:hypothetical protein
MKKLLFISILAVLAGTLRAQSTSDLTQTDNAVRALAAELAQKLTAERVQTVAIGQFGGSVQFSSYLNNQLFGELTNIPGRSFTLVSAGGSAQWTISGEIVRIGNMMRLYTRLVRRDDNTVVSQISTNLEMNQSLAAMLSSGNSDGEAMVFADAMESDSRDAPVVYSGDASTMMRTIHEDDNDWFLVTATETSVLVLQTSGSMDTYMTLYDADTQDEIASNDDGGNDSNAKIEQFAQPGKRYLVMVRGYSDSSTGEYGFRAHTEAMEEPIPYENLGDINSSRFVMRTLDSNGDLFLLVAPSSGTMVIETTGDTDVVMELLDATTYAQLDEDDDSGTDTNARIGWEVERGGRYLARVRAYSSGGGGRYGFKAYMQYDRTASETRLEFDRAL